MRFTFHAGVWRAFALTTGVAGSTTAIGLGAQLLLLRELPGDHAGRFATLLAIIYALGVLGAMGQGTLMARRYNQSEGEARDWLRDLRNATGIAALAILPTVGLVLTPLFDLSWLETLVVIGCAVAFAMIHCGGSVLTQKRYYTASSLLVRLPNVLLGIPALWFLLQPGAARLEVVLLSMLAGFLVALGATLMVLRRRVPLGRRALGWGERREGFLFFGGALALVVPDRGLVAVAGAMLPPAEVAALAAIAGLVRVLDLVADSTVRVLSTEIARNPERISWRVLAPVWLMAGVLAIGMLLGIPPLIHHFYQGRFDAGLTAAPWLIFAAALTVVEVLPRGYIAYRAVRRVLVWHVVWQAAAAVAGLGMSLPLVKAHGLLGVALAGVLIAVARAGGTYYYALFFAEQRRMVSS